MTESQFVRLLKAIDDLQSDAWWEQWAIDHWTEKAPTTAEIIRKRIDLAETAQRIEKAMSEELLNPKGPK